VREPDPRRSRERKSGTGIMPQERDEIMIRFRPNQIMMTCLIGRSEGKLPAPSRWIDGLTRGRLQNRSCGLPIDRGDMLSRVGDVEPLEGAPESKAYCQFHDLSRFPIRRRLRGDYAQAKRSMLTNGGRILAFAKLPTDRGCEW
jgi:hypothetical protein